MWDVSSLWFEHGWTIFIQETQPVSECLWFKAFSTSHYFCDHAKGLSNYDFPTVNCDYLIPPHMITMKIKCGFSKDQVRK